MTTVQEIHQTDGPHRPTVRQLQLMLGKIPGHVEIRAISINGQIGQTLIETTHDGMERLERFRNPEYYDVIP